MERTTMVMVPEAWIKAAISKLDRILENQEAMMAAESREPTGTTLTAEEAAAYLQVDRNTIYRWTRQNRIPHRKVGSKLLYYKGELDAWMKER